MLRKFKVQSFILDFHYDYKHNNLFVMSKTKVLDKNIQKILEYTCRTAT